MIIKTIDKKKDEILKKAEFKSDDVMKNLVSEMKLYTVHGIFTGDYFDTLEEFNEYLDKNKVRTNDIGVVEYIRTLAGIDDVIKFTLTNGNFLLFTAVDEYGYCVYNNYRSMYRGDFNWEYKHGNLRSVYKAFKDRGIQLENDIYERVDERNNQLYELMNKVLRKHL